MSIYATYDADQLEELQSQFLVDSWSYSKVTTFARNEKAFEMQYIFNTKPKLSATTIAGQAYHEALQCYFGNKKGGNALTLADLETIAFQYIDDVRGNTWRLQKTTPTVDDCKAKALTTCNALLKFFLAEVAVYEDELAEILGVELKGSEWLTVNGVDIPLMCNYVIDLIIRLKDGRIVVIDHKSKAGYTSDDEIALTVGKQAITYVLCYEARTGEKVDEVWFVENKYSANKDKSPQLQAFKIELTHDVRRLYEALLYEPLRRMITAVNDPDYVYIINDNDQLVDRAELSDFWARTMICEVGDFNIADDKKEIIEKRLKKIRDASATMVDAKVIREFKENAATFIQYDLSHTNMTPEQKIEHVLRSFGTIVRVAHKMTGYSSDTYLLEVSAGVKVSSISSHRLDLANALDVSNVRVSRNLTVYQGKSYLSVEISKRRENDLLFDVTALSNNRIPIGKDNFDTTIVWDLDNHSTPHALVCGATGSGKSVCIMSTIEYALAAGVSEIIIFDPKYEFTQYHRRGRITVFNEIADIEAEMIRLVEDMNQRVARQVAKRTLVVFDEFADALAQSRKGKELCGDKSLGENLRVLLQKGRSSGFRIIAATQRASVKVITGDAKVNFPVQICFRVPKGTDSRVVLDEEGAESLAGMGDGLMRSPEYPELVRFQAYYKPSNETTAISA